AISVFPGEFAWENRNDHGSVVISSPGRDACSDPSGSVRMPCPPTRWSAGWRFASEPPLMKVTDFVPVHGPNPRPRRLTRRQAVRLGALLPMAALAASACAPEPPPLIEGADNLSSGGAEGRHLQQILDRRAKAQLDGDEEAYLADLDSSKQELIAREKMVFANLRQFALADVRFITSRALPRPLGEGTDRYAVQPVIKVVKLTADDGPAGVLGPGEAYEYVLAKQGEKWVIADAVP